MSLDPFLAVAVIFAGLISFLVGNRMIRNSSASVSAEGQKWPGIILAVLGLTTIACVFVLDPEAVFEFVPKVKEMLYGSLYSDG